MRQHTIEEKLKACRLLNELEVDRPLGDDRMAIQQKYCYEKAIIFCLVYFEYLTVYDRERFYSFYEDYLETGHTKPLIDFLEKAKKSIMG